VLLQDEDPASCPGEEQSRHHPCGSASSDDQVNIGILLH
jgi:hypothetical protein